MGAPHTSVITRLVRNCALGRVIQYAAASRFFVIVSGILDRPPSRAMTVSAGAVLQPIKCKKSPGESETFSPSQDEVSHLFRQRKL